MPIAITKEQRDEININGVSRSWSSTPSAPSLRSQRGWQYTVIENVLQGDALQRVLDAVAVTPGGRGRHAVCEEIRELMEHEAILPLVVDVAGWNIQ